MAGIRGKKTMAVDEPVPLDNLARDQGTDPTDKVVKDLRKVQIPGGDLEHYFLLGKNFPPEEASRYEEFLFKNIGNFAWVTSDMEGLDLSWHATS